MWNVERGIPHSNHYSKISECGTWNCPCENISPLTMLINYKCIGMWKQWNMECGILHPNSRSRILECGIWNVAANSKSRFQGPGLKCGMWNCFFENISPLTMLKCIGMWNVMWKSTFQFQNFGIWNVECGFPNSTFQIYSKFWNGNWNVATFHISHIPNYALYLELSVTFQIPFHCGCHKLIYNVVQFKFHSNSTVDGMTCGISV
jgi:hypothetical protein